ncbi:toxin TcdB middle/N-terminal domain-containing protein [Rheinheimera baltica]|uniref:toxin TcdB middle/N-terminal domain-containing protein n=1 Tax=Rheinheimera baltica TaxID=67576 RepID=UPI0004269EA0|nr:toxin TcdB middle/N-terminal domain-containing protein [Rheinheimera baltica]
MRAVIRCVLLTMSIMAGFAAKADTGGYLVYTDYAGNIYLEAPKKFVLIHSEFSVPLFLVPANGLLKLVQNANGWQFEVLTQAQWNAAGLTSGHNGVASVEFADINRDGKADLRVNFANITLGALLVSDINGNPLVSEISSANNSYDPVELPTSSSMPASVVGLSAGEFRVDESGGATYQLPLSLPAGIAGVQPQLAFSYNSNAGDGYMGTGWSFAGTSAITRCPKNFAIDGVQGNVAFANSDRLCLGGQRLLASSNTDAGYWTANTYYPEIEDFSVIRSHGSATQGALGYTVETKSGEIHYYGEVSAVSGSDNMAKSLAATFKTADGAVQTGSDAFFNTKSGENIARMWALKAIRDVKGNYIVFKYAEDLTAGEHYLTEVHYTGRVGGNAPFAKVTLEYIANPKKAQGWQAGVPVSMTKLLKKVHVKVDNEYYRHYQLNYQTTNVVEEKTYLESVQECVTNDGKGCLPLTSLKWSHPALATPTSELVCPGYRQPCVTEEGVTDFKPFETTSTSRNFSNERAYTQFIDINGDGFVDIVYLRSNRWRVRLGSLTSVWTERCSTAEGFRDCYDETALSAFDTEIDLGAFGVSNAAYVQTIDYDGDGKRDLLVAENANMTWRVMRFKPSSSTKPSCVRPQEVNCGSTTTNYAYTLEDTFKKAYGYNTGATVADVDGDGLEDIVFIKDNKFQVYRNLGVDALGEHRGMSLNSDFGSFGSTDPADGIATEFRTASADMKSASMFDVNGDGKTDVILKVTEGSCSKSANSKGDCTEAGGTWSIGTVYKLYTSDGSRYNETQTLGQMRDIRAADLNGDGYTDLIYRNKSNNFISYRLSNGKIFYNTVQSSYSLDDSNINLAQFVDINGDGRTDFLIPETTSRWKLELTKAATSTGQVSFENRGTLDFDSGATVRFTDINADGKLDMVLATSNSGWKIFTSQRPFIKDHVIKGITNGWGVKTSINYQLMVDTKVYINRDSNNNLDTDYFSPLSAMYVVSDVSTDTTGTKAVRVDYQYGGLLLHKKGRGMLGFEMLQTIDKQTNVLTRTVYHQLWPFTGIPKFTSQWLGEDKLLSSAENTLAYVDITSGETVAYSGTGEVASARVFPFVQSSEEFSFQLGSDMATVYKLAQTNSSFAYDRFGNLTASTVVQANPDEPSFKQTTSTTNSYTGIKTNYPRYGRLTSSKVTKTLVDSKGTQSSTRKSSFGYNNDLMLETETLAPDEPKFRVVTSHSYDAAGNNTGKTIRAATNAVGTGLQSRSSSTVYDSRYRYVKQTTDALGYKTNFTYNSLSADSITGRIDYITQVDTNNQLSRVYFDITGRQYRSYSKGAASSDPIINAYSAQDYCTAVSCGVSGAYARVRSWGDGQGEKQQFLDKFGREIATKVKLMDGNWSTTESTYDDQGRPKRSYEPYKTGSSATLYSEASYDDLGRVFSTRLANAAVTSVAYQGLTSITTDTLNHTRTTLNNYAGQTREVIDHDGNKLAYYYDANGNLTSVVATDKGGISSVRTTNTYDAYGRKTAIADQDKGNWSYSYNAFGELLSQTNAKQQVTSFMFDSVGRQLRRHDASGTTCWDYGDSEISYNRGKLVRVRAFNSTVDCDTTISADYKEMYGYNSRGLVSNKLVRTAGSSFASSTSYDSYNRLYTLTYPSWSLNPSDDIVVLHEYSTHNGMLTTLKDHKGIKSQYFQKVNISSVNARGQATKVDYGNGVTENRSFYADTGWVENLNLQKSGVSLHSFHYVFDTNGNLDSREQRFGINSNASFSENFVYDNLDRLKTRTIANIGNSTAYNALPSTLRMSESYAYDNWGNIKSKTNVGHYSYDTNKTNRLTGVWSGANGTGTRYYNFAYDSNGNIESDGKRSFTYTAFEKPSRIKQGSNYTDFAYGPDRQLYRRTDLRGGKTTDTIYIDGLYERMTKSSGESEHKFYVGNAVITKRSNSAHSDILYLHKDNQGSTISITDKAGKVVQQFIYDPWGKQYSVSSNSLFSTYSNPGDSKGYTGHNMINDFDVIHMGGRTYNPILGRFMQADPFIQAPSNLQNYNRYSYVLNNPMSYTDPSGYFFKKLLRSIAKIPLLNMAVQAVLAFYCQICLVAYNAAQTYAVTGSLRAAAISAVVSRASPGGGSVGRVLASGMIGGLASKAQGGKFAHGFVSAGLGAAAGGRINTGNAYANVIVSAVVGGTISKLSGGKFANGAQTWAFHSAIAQDWRKETAHSTAPLIGEGGSELTPEQRDAVFKNAKAELLKDGLIKPDDDIEFINKFLFIKKSPDGTVKPENMRLFDTLEKADEFLSTQESEGFAEASGLNPIGPRGGRVIQSRIYASATNSGLIGFVGTSGLFDLNSVTNVKFTIIHEQGHGLGFQAEFQANDHAIKTLKLQCSKVCP